VTYKLRNIIAVSVKRSSEQPWIY